MSCPHPETWFPVELGFRSALGAAVEDLLSMLAVISMRIFQGNILLTFCILQLERSEVVAENLGVCIVVFTISTTATYISAVTWPTVALSLPITLAGLPFVEFLPIDALPQILHPSVDFGLGLKKSFADIVTDNREIVFPE